MILLMLKFSDKDEKGPQFDVVPGESLKSAIERATKEIPRGHFELKDMFMTVRNGRIVDSGLWETITLDKDDFVIIVPRVRSGESGQLFKQALLIAIAIAVTAAYPPGAGATFSLTNTLLVVGTNIAASLALNALIPPPVPTLNGATAVGGGPEDSQTFTITGQSNQVKRYGIVPKVYGYHRIFPTLAANPYTELATSEKGEIIQYLCAIYDFGLGNPLISDIKIGDTPLNKSNFKDFTVRFVDPNRPDIPEDEIDETLSKEFTLYKDERVVTPLSISLEDGGSAIQNSDSNPKGLTQEISLDFVCPRGLFGFSSSGDKGDRKINLTIEFSPANTTDWKGYNDMTAVDSYEWVGANDLKDYGVNVYEMDPDHEDASEYYAFYQPTTVSGSSTGPTKVYILPDTKKLALPKSVEIAVGAKCFYAGKDFLGIVESVTDAGDHWSVTLDRVMSKFLYYHLYNYRANTIPSQRFEQIAGIRIGRHATSWAAIEASSTHPVYASVRFKPKTKEQIKIRVRRRTTTTTAFPHNTADDLTWAALTTAYNKSNEDGLINTTKRHTFMELRIRATDQLNGAIQNLSAIAHQTLDVYDSDTDTWSRQATTNPAWILCDLLTGEVNKKPVPKERLHMESILAWKEYCDEVPDAPPGQTFVTPRFQCSFILDYETTLQEVINSVCGAAQASLNIIDGKYGVLIDRLKTVPVQIFTPRNSSGFTSSRFYAPQPHALKVTYIDPNLDWETAECIVYDNGFDEETATEFDEIKSFGCIFFEQAWRFGRYMIAQNRLRQETISIQVDFENLVCTRGDYVQVANDVMQVGGSPARVVTVSSNRITIDDRLDINDDINYGYTYRSSEGEIKTSTLTPVSPNTFDLDGTDIPEPGDLIVIGEVDNIVIDCIVKSIEPNDDLSAQITLVERANEIFDYESESEIPDYDPQLSNTSRPDFAPPKAVTDLTLADVSWECADTQSGYIYYADIVWDIPQGSVYEHFEIWYDNGSGYKAVATTTNKLWRQHLDFSRIGDSMGLKVLAVSASGRKLDLVNAPEVTFDTGFKTEPPDDVTGLGISVTDQVLQISWDFVDSCDIAKYEVRYSPETNDSWEASVPLQDVDRNVNSLSVQARTGIYFVKAVDFAGNKSINATSAITTIPNLFNLNIIETINDAPDFEGLKEQVVEFGDALILETETDGDPNTMSFFSDGYYYLEDIIDLGEIYSTRLQSRIRADGYRYGEVMSGWEHLEDVEHLSSATTDDWDITVEYRTTTEILSMSKWEHLSDVEHLNEGDSSSFTEWRPIPTIGDATGRVFQFRVHFKSLTPNVTPRLFDATIEIDMPDRIESFENLTSSDSESTVITYAQKFAGPEPSPNVQISVDSGQPGDYWTITNKTLEGFEISFFDESDTQVSRQFDVVAKGYGRRHISVI